MQSCPWFLLHNVDPFLAILILQLENQPWLDILDKIGVGLVIENQSETLIESFIDRILNNFDSRFGWGLRHIDGHIGECIFKEDTLSYCSCFLCNTQDPADIRVVLLLLTQLNNSIPISVEVYIGTIFVLDQKGIRFLSTFIVFNDIMLTGRPISKSQFALPESTLKHQSGESMDHLMQLPLPYKLNHPHLIEVEIVVLAEDGCFSHVLGGRDIGDHENLSGAKVEDVVVVTRSELYFLDWILHINIICEYSSISERSTVASTTKEKSN